MRKLFLSLAVCLVTAFAWAGETDLLWDYTEAQIPTTGPDRGLYYAAYVNDAPSSNNGLNGVKLNSSGWAYFEKAPVAKTHFREPQSADRVCYFGVQCHEG